MTRQREARLVSGWADASALYDVLVGDDPLGFWWDVNEEAEELSYIGVGDRLCVDPEFPQKDGAAAWPGPGRFAGGWIGWFGYEHTGGSVGSGRISADANSAWLRVDRFVAIDPVAMNVWAVAPPGDIDEWADRITEAVAAGVQREPASAPSSHVTAEARHHPCEYEKLIDSARDEIRAGEAYQLCLTTRFTVPGQHDAPGVHHRLRKDRAPFGALIRARERSLVAASPEAFLRLSAGGHVRTSPIKGTRTRAADPERDAAFARELVDDPKERAENLMIVDLMRNDFSRVCEAGSIRVERLFHVESHAHVHQLVSDISGQLSAGNGVREVLAACFPAGSMTGAPKENAMTILARLEGAARGAYSGCFGWIGDDGAALLAMTIRCVLISDDEAHVGAGGGITIDSDPDFEVSEVALKARAPLRALGAQLPTDWAAYATTSSPRPLLV